MPDGYALEFEDIRKEYGPVVALDRVSVGAAYGEFLTILGQSGSGKTTLLRIAAGLEQPTSASRISIGGKDMTGVPPYEREVNTVFQHYGLFPHMTVQENVEYGLKLRRVAAPDRKRRANAMLERVRLPGKGARKINQLSGGERQRVALARSLVLDPKILLLDEPLGALDERLRLDMQIELVELQRTLGTTFVFITHSQEEALTMSDRIILMRHGRIAQEGTPKQLFENPASDFCAGFMGVENLIAGQIASVEGSTVTIACSDQALRGTWTGAEPPVVGQPAGMAVRAERIAFAPGESSATQRNAVPGRITTQVYKGKYIDLLTETPLGRMVVRTWDRNPAAETITLRWLPEDAAVAPRLTS